MKCHGVYCGCPATSETATNDQAFEFTKYVTIRVPKPIPRKKRMGPDHTMTEHHEDKSPKLAIIKSKHTAGGKSTIRKQCSRTSRSNATSRSGIQNIGKSDIGLQDLSLGPDDEFQKMEVSPPKSRRRILKRASNNPLLRPLHSQRGNRSSRSSSTSSNIACKVSPIGLRACSKAKRHVATSNDISDETYSSAADTTGLSSFIVDDDSYIESEGTVESPRVHLRTTTRKLVRGRRHPSSDAIRVGHSETVEDSQSLQGIKSKSPRRGIETDGRQTGVGHGRSNISDQEKAQKKLEMQPPKYNIDSKLWEDDFSPEPNDLSLPSQSHCISPTKPLPDHSFKTPPQSPSKSKSRLISPKKPPQIPLTPHQTNTDAFWTRDVIDEWNDQFSPKKVLNLACDEIGDAGNSWAGKSIKKGPESTLNRTVARARKDFNRRKHDIAEAFLQDLDRVITDWKVSKLAASTGGVRIIWSKTLNTTAGRANWKRETVKTTRMASNGKSIVEIMYRHHASIEISEKVIDDEDRLLNVIAHEFCHLANFMVSGVRNNPHGKEFKVWASKCSQMFGDRGINVTTKHTYVIDYKYIWTCTNCGTEFKRHSKSIDPQRHQCGSCKSKLVQTKPVPRAAVTVNEYQLFVKENMGRIKADNPGSPQKDIMSLVGKLYQKHKASRLGDDPIGGVTAGAKEEGFSGSEKGPCGGDAVDLVARRLNFLDLTSP